MHFNLRISSLIAALLVAILGLATVSHGIRVVTRVPFRVREAERRFDHTPPSRPTLEVKSIWRGEGMVKAGDNWVNYSEADRGSITLRISGVSDDRTPADSLGYRIHFVDGLLPRGLTLPKGAYVQSNRHPYLDWRDENTWEQEPFAFRIFVTALDWAGNESAPSDTITVEHNGDTSEQKAIRTREARRSRAEMRPAEVDSIADRPFIDAIREFVGALSNGEVEYAYNLLSAAGVQFTNADGSVMEFHSRAPYDKFKTSMGRWKGVQIAAIKRMVPFSAVEGEGADIAGIREYSVFIERETESEWGRISIVRISAVLGTDGRVRLFQAE